VRLPSGRLVRFGRRIRARRAIDDVLVLLFDPRSPTDPDNVVAIDTRGRVRWRKSSWVPDSRRGKGFYDPYTAVGREARTPRCSCSAVT
jgi:hypothetical protein